MGRLNASRNGRGDEQDDAQGWRCAQARADERELCAPSFRRDRGNNWRLALLRQGLRLCSIIRPGVRNSCLAGAAGSRPGGHRGNDQDGFLHHGAPSAMRRIRLGRVENTLRNLVCG